MRLEFESNATAFPLVESETVNEPSPSEGEQLLRAGVKAAQEGRRSEAKALLLRVTEIEPANENAWLWLASISEYPEELLVFLNNVLKVNPNNQRAIEWKKATRSLLAKTLVQRGVDASREERQAFARQCFEQAVEHDSENELAWLWLASIADSESEKLEIFEKVLKINPENETALAAVNTAHKDHTADILHDAVCEAVEGNHFAAQELLAMVLKEDENLEEAWVLKAHLANSFEERAECFLRVRSINPENEMARACLASWREFVAKSGEQSFSSTPAAAAEPAPVASEPAASDLSAPVETESESTESYAGETAEAPASFVVDAVTEFEPAQSAVPEALSGNNGYAAPDLPTQDLNSVPAFRFEHDEPMMEVAVAEPAPETESAMESEKPFELDLASQIAADEEEMSAAFDDLHRTTTPDRDTDVEYALRSEQNYEPFEAVAERPADEEAEWKNTSPEVFFGYSQDSENRTVVEEPLATAQQLQMPEPEPVAEAPVEVKPDLALCPFCNSENERQALACGSCSALLSLSDLDGVFNEHELNADVIQQAVDSFEREHESYGLNAEQLAQLGMGHVNLKNFRQGYLYLQEAVHANPSNVVLDAQLNAFAIRLEEFEKLQTAHDAMSKNRKILVVDDSPTVRKLISSKLEKCGHEVVCAVDGLDALEKLNSVRPDLILLDITMPRMDGYQVCKLIRNNTDMKDVPVVMISGKDGFFDKVRGRMAGTTDYITKPFGPETLMKTVENYLS